MRDHDAASNALFYRDQFDVVFIVQRRAAATTAAFDAIMGSTKEASLKL